MAQTATHNHRTEAPLGLVLEAGVEIATLGAIAIILCAISKVEIGQGGLILGSAIYIVIGIL
ncbi:MAG TPA: hypothetical protein VKA94_01610, partial [Hyphomicrobiales bacterium]|nr:hypothetical protein [Hyphomicrobiales bacterium]